MKRYVLILSILLFALTAFGMNTLLPRRASHYNFYKDANSKLLIHSNTTDGSTTFTDSIGTHTITEDAGDGSVQHDTAQKKFGTTSMLFDGTDGTLSIPDHADWNLGSGKLTIAFWVKLANASDNSGVFDQNVDNDNRWGLYFWDDAGTQKITFAHRTGASTTIGITAETGSLNDAFHHIAIIRGWGGDANSWAITVDGSPIVTATDSDSIADMAVSLRIGINDFTAGYMDGWIDEVVWVKGTAIWTAPFWLPIKAYE